MLRQARGAVVKIGESVAVRIPAGWLDPLGEVTLHRDPHTQHITISQGPPSDSGGFFDFLRGEEHLVDPSLRELTLRHDRPLHQNYRGHPELQAL